MASNYEKIMELVNAGNKMGLSNTITRDNGIPLDLSSVQENYETAVIYAATKAIAYIGQPVSVGGTLYIISDTAAEEKYVAVDGTEYDNYLKEVGSVPALDELSVALNEDGAIELKGFKAAAGATLPQVKIAEDGSRTLEWVSIDAIVEGDGNTKTVIAIAENSALSVTPTYDSTNDTYTYTLDITLPEVAQYTVTVDERVDGDTSTTYHLTKDGANAGVAIVVPDAYNDSALAQRVTDVETDVTEIKKFFETAEGETLNQALDTLAEIQKEIAADDASAAAMLASINANTAAIETLNGTGEGSVDKKIADAISAQDFSGYVTEQELTDKGYAVAADVDETYAKKADVYTKTEVYSKSETDIAIADAVKSATGGESASDVLIELNNYKKAINRELWGTEEVADYTGTDSRIDALESADTAQDTLIASNTILAQKGVDDATAAKSAADAAAAQADTNKTDIAAITTRLGNVETASGTNTEKVGVLEGRVTALEAKDTELAAQIGTISGNLSTFETNLTAKDSELAALIAGNTTNITANADAIKLKANAADVYTKTEVDGLLANLDQTEINNAIAANTQAIADEKARAEAAEKANADAIAALTEEGGQVAKNTADIAALDATLKAAIENEGEGLDSIKELAIWVETHGPEAAAMSQAITALEAKVDTGDQTVSAYVAAQIAAIPSYNLPAATVEALGGVKLSNEIGVNEAGQLKITKVTTDVLVNGAEEFIINGGNADGAVSA